MQTDYKTQIERDWGQYGVKLKENDDHILELWQGENPIARFSQVGVDVINVLKEIRAGKYAN